MGADFPSGVIADRCSAGAGIADHGSSLPVGHEEAFRIGGKTIAIYIGTTVVALCIGLLLVNIMQPGDSVPEDMRERLEATFADQAEAGMANAAQAADRGPLDPLVNMVPGNVFFAATNNRNMLQIVFFAIFAGIALLMIPKDKARPLLDFFDGLNDLIIKMVEIIMLAAPVGVFARDGGYDNQHCRRRSG